MSQHSFNIANEAGAAFRTDVNAALQALASVSRGNSPPATPYIGQYWEDTTNSLLRRLNAAGNAWTFIASLDETFVVSRASNTILGLADYGKTFIGTGTFTQTLTAVATLLDGWNCWYRNDGSGVITLDPNASETIDGFTTLALQPGESCRIACNGSAFKTQGLTQPRIVVKRKTADESVTSSTTLQDDDHLTFPIGANEEWAIDFYLDAGALLGGTGIKVGYNTPGVSALNFVAGIFLNNTSTSVPNTLRTTTTTSASLNFTTTIVGASATDGFLVISMWVLNGAIAGSITLQWAQSTSFGTALTLRKGSYMRAMRVA